MTSDIATRRHAASALLRCVKTPAGRARLASAGHRHGEPIIVVLDSDTLGYVFGRLYEENPNPPAIVMMYRAERAQFAIWSIAPIAGPIAEDDEGAMPATHSATIGMLYDTMVANHRMNVDLQLHAVGGGARLSPHELVGSPC